MSPARPNVSRLTPILPVETIEPLLPFWVDRLGFEITAEVPEGDSLGFVILEAGPAQLMLQTHDSIASDDARIAGVISPGTTLLFLEVESIEAVQEALSGWPDTLIPYRETFYGAREVFIRGPAGEIVGFAQFDHDASD